MPPLNRTNQTSTFRISQTSVKDIGVLVDNTNEKINKATETARQSQDIFIDIQQKIEDTARIMQDISATAMEQQVGVDQVNRAVAEMDTVTQNNAALVQESADTSESLLEQAHALRDTVSFFKLNASDLTEKTSIKEKKESKENKAVKETSAVKEVKENKEFKEYKKDDKKIKNNIQESKKDMKIEAKEINPNKEHFESKKQELKVPPSVEKARAAMKSQKMDNTTVRNDEFGVTYSSTSNEMTDDGFAAF